MCGEGFSASSEMKPVLNDHLVDSIHGCQWSVAVNDSMGCRHPCTLSAHCATTPTGNLNTKAALVQGSEGECLPCLHHACSFWYVAPALPPPRP